MADDGKKLRKPSDSPFCWQSKPALRKIRESFDAEKVVASAIGLYVALTEIASDGTSETFTTTHGWIAQKSGLSPRTVQDRLSGLSEINLVRISTPALKCPSTYQLLPVPQPLPDDKQLLPNVRQRTKNATLPSLEENKKNLPKESKEECDADAASAVLILDFLNQKTGRKYKPVANHINSIEARLSEVDGDLEGVKRMIERQCSKWGSDPKMVDYLRISTLFNKTKFHDYFSARDLPLAGREPTDSPKPDHEKGFKQT